MLTRKILPLLCFFLLMTVGTVNATVVVFENSPLKEKRDSLTEAQKARVRVLENRVAEIKTMDRSTLSKADRKALRRELKDLNREARKMSGKSFVLILTTLIAVILLLILLL